MKQIDTVIFDMDGTLYQIDGKDTGFKGSSLEQAVISNACRFVQEREGCDESQARNILKKAVATETISTFLAQRYGITRSEYFDFAWKIDPEGIVQKYEEAVKLVKLLKEQEIATVLLTAAPKMWQQIVIAYLGLQPDFDLVYTGEMFGKKDEVFAQLAATGDPTRMLSVGDQQKSDIEPAAALGIKTVWVRSPEEVTLVLEYLQEQGGSNEE